MIYYVIFVVLIILALFNDVVQVRQIKKYRKNIYIICGVFLVIFGSSRFQTGYDYTSYEEIFNTISSMNIGSALFSDALNIEKGFILINFVFKKLDYSIFLFIITSFSIGSKLVYFYKNTNKHFIILLFYYASIYMTYDMGVIRQGIAVAILLWGYKAIEEKNTKKFLILVLIASSIHITSMVMLPMIFIKERKYERLFYYVLIAASITVMYFHITSSILPFISNFGGDIVTSKLKFYSSEYYIQSDITISMLKRIIIFVLFYEYINYKKLSGIIYLYINAYLLSIIISCVFCDVAILANRGTVILYATQIIIFSYIIGKEKDISLKLIVFILVISLSLVSLNGPIQDKNISYVPYKSSIEGLLK